MRIFLTSYFSQHPPFPISSVIILAIFIGASCTQLPDFPKEDSSLLDGFQVQDGFEISLVVAEPLIVDPVDMEIDENGRLFVVEMPGYPLDLSKKGRIKELRDTDNDGLPDQSILFADSLVLPTGIMRWKKGFIVTDTPDVLYLEDTNGDGKADRREVLLTGFALSNPQHNMNNPEFGLDNWIYLANEGYFTTIDYKDLLGDEGSAIRFPQHPEAPQLPQNGGDRNVRFRPDQLQLEMCSGSTQFGQAFDAWGHHFETSNFHPLWHEVIAARYLERNPSLLAVEAVQYLPDAAVNEVFPRSQSPEHQLLTDVGVITSGCGINWYTGGLFPTAFEEVLFLCEPVHNLVQANKISAVGPTFRSHRLEEGREFLSSTDNWFRPANTYIGPDGALYVIDYHRKIIEHPEWMSDEVNESGQLYDGTDKGRIYRIVPKGSAGIDWLNKLALGNKSKADLVPYLSHQNSWWRKTAQKLLVFGEEAANDPIDAIKALIKESEGAGRVHGLWTLEGLDELDSEMLALAMKDPMPGVRENALQLAEHHLDDIPELIPAMLKMQDDPDPRVRFQLLCTLGFVEGKAAQQVRETLLLKDLDNDWTHLAALSAIPGQEKDQYKWAMAQFKGKEDSGGIRFVKNLAALIGRKGINNEISFVIDEVLGMDKSHEAFKVATLEGLAQGIGNSDQQAALPEASLDQLLGLSLDEVAGLRQPALRMLKQLGLPANKGRLTAATNSALQLIQQTETSITRQADAIKLLTLINPAQHLALFKNSLQPNTPSLVQLAAIKGMESLQGLDNTRFLLALWSQLTPEVRGGAIESFRDYPDRMHLFLDEVEAGRIAAQGIGPKQIFEILKNDDKTVRRRATKLLETSNGDRAAVLKDYQETLNGEGLWEKGKVVFEAQCAKCHQLGGEGGYPLGPDLAGIRNRTEASILHDILIPNAAIADGYDVWTVVTTNEETFSGIIASETPSVMTFRFLDTPDKVVSRTTIKSLTSAPVSLMTTGLEQQISKAEMIDLLAYLKNKRDHVE
ncbi:MAG: c-type cytochrome [Saprospiraceae bacterium]